MNVSKGCKSVFKSDDNTTSSEKVTEIWIKLINQLEKSKATLARAG